MLALAVAVATSAQQPGTTLVAGVVTAPLFGVLMWSFARRGASQGRADLARVSPPAAGAGRCAVRRGLTVAAGLAAIEAVAFVALAAALGSEDVLPIPSSLLLGLVLGLVLWQVLAVVGQAREQARDGLELHTRVGAPELSWRTQPPPQRPVLVAEQQTG